MAIFSSASGSNNGQLNVACAGSWHTLHTGVARHSNVKDKDGVSVLVVGEFGGLMASLGGAFDRRRVEQVDDMVDRVSTTWAVLLIQLRKLIRVSVSVSSFWWLCTFLLDR